MLAVDVITDKLRDQSLEESKSANNSTIKFVHPNDGFKLSKNTEAKLAGSGKKVWTVQLNSSREKHSSYPDKSPKKDYGKSESQVSCPHGQRTNMCFMCENTPNIPSTPPKKRHCKTLFMPVEGPAPSSWQGQAAELHKPVTVIPNRNQFSDTFPTNFHGGDISVNTSGFVSIAPPVGQFERGFVSPCDIFTPPESPVPRPSSASTCSGRYDGAFSPLGAPWLEHSLPGGNKYSAFQNRSLSVEDEISNSMTGSTASVPGCINSVPSSPHRHRIPRCKSQPSFIRERRCGIKRRRDYDRRPALDFHKMTETAYEQHGRPVASSHRNKERTGSRFHEELESVMSLMPIASSPMDNDFPVKRIMEARASPIREMDHGGRDSAEFFDDECLDNDDNRTLKVIEADANDCECGDVEEEIFTLQEDLDLEQIENH